MGSGTHPGRIFALVWCLVVLAPGTSGAAGGAAGGPIRGTGLVHLGNTLAAVGGEGRYAMLIVSYLHHKPEGGNARAIAERFGLSRPFVANILKELCHKGYVASHRGVKGGYALKESARAVTLADTFLPQPAKTLITKARRTIWPHAELPEGRMVV